MVERIFHVSDRPGIERFDPRPAPSPGYGLDGEMVWAIREGVLHNYLLPRDCPRVTFYASPGSSSEDIERFLGLSAAGYVVAIESGWLPEVRRACLYLYEMPPEAFTPSTDGSGYCVSRTSVVPLSVRQVNDLLGELTRRDVELRIVPSLWKLSDAVIKCSLAFSNIRMRNASPRPV